MTSPFSSHCVAWVLLPGLGCTRTEPVEPTPQARFAGTNQTGPGHISLLNQSSGATASRRDVGDGRFNTQTSPIHTYSRNGDYLIFRTVSIARRQESTGTQPLTSGQVPGQVTFWLNHQAAGVVSDKTVLRQNVVRRRHRI